jgi:predicted nucleic acid-binding protein
MRVGYLDTSVLVAIAFDEPRAARLTKQVRSFDKLLSSSLLESEFLAVAEREGVRDRASNLLEPISWVFPDRRLAQEIHRILDIGYIRGADLYHLATALLLFPAPRGEFFLTLDQRQGAIARELGFAVLE